MSKEPGFNFHPMCKQLRLNNLAFADDLLILCKGDLTSVQKLSRILREFEELSGLTANLLKSKLFLGGVTPHISNTLLSATGFQLGHIPLRYQGFPIAACSWSKSECYTLVEKVRSRVSCWSSRHLSFAGILHLFNSVLHAFHIYWSSAFLVPKGVLDEINKICHQFLRSGNSQKRKPAPVNWEELCHPKRVGGLGLKNIYQWNLAAIGMQVWNISAEKDDLWVKWVSGVYLRGADF